MLIPGPDSGSADAVGLAVFNSQAWAATVVESQYTQLSPTTAVVLYGAGLLSALSPCALSLLPLTLAYLSSETQQGGGGGGRVLFTLSGFFGLGLAAALAGLGLLALSLGQLFGSVGSESFVPVAAAAVSVACGLNLLDLVSFRIPGLGLEAAAGFGRIGLGKVAEMEAEAHAEAETEAVSSDSRAARAFVFGASSALVSSPCSTPVLASLLGFVAASGQANSALGLGLLLTYTLGYVTPVVAAGAFGTAATSALSDRGGEASELVVPVFGGGLVAYGVYSGLEALFPS